MRTNAFFSGGPLDRQERAIDGKPEQYNETEVLENYGDVYRYKEHNYELVEGKPGSPQDVLYKYIGFTEKEL